MVNANDPKKRTCAITTSVKMEEFIIDSFLKYYQTPPPVEMWRVKAVGAAVENSADRHNTRDT